MKNKTISILIIFLFVFTLTGGANAATLKLFDWQFNPDGTGLAGTFQPIDEITLIGTSLIENDAYPATNVGFSEKGAFSATSFVNGGSPIPVATTGLGLNYELTSLFTADGVNTNADLTNQTFDFNTGTLDIYIDTNLNFGSTDSFYGTDDGIHIASFNLDYGDGNLDFTTPAGPDGRIDIQFSANTSQLTNGFAPGYWFDVDGNDFSDFTFPTIALGLVDGNNNILEEGDLEGTNTISEFGVLPNPPNAFYTRTDGSFQPAVVPEPSTFLLLGGGLIGLGFYARRRKQQ